MKNLRRFRMVGARHPPRIDASALILAISAMPYRKGEADPRGLRERVRSALLPVLYRSNCGDGNTDSNLVEDAVR